MVRFLRIADTIINADLIMRARFEPATDIPFGAKDRLWIDYANADASLFQGGEAIELWSKLNNLTDTSEAVTR